MKTLLQIVILSSIVIFLFGTNVVYSSPQMHDTTTKVQPICTDNSHKCIKDTVGLYLDALVKHDAANVPFDNNAKRYENGVLTANSDEELRKSITDDVKIKSVHKIRDVTYAIDGNQAVVFYLIDLVMPYTKIHLSTTRLAARFEVNNGLIKEVEVVFCNSLGSHPEERKISSAKAPNFVCQRSVI